MELSRGNTIVLGGNCLGGIVQGAIVLDGNYPGGNCLGDNCPRWELTWEQLSRWQLPDGGKGVGRGGNCPGDNFLEPLQKMIMSAFRVSPFRLPPGHHPGLTERWSLEHPETLR